jgi:hypothetical protein
MIGMLEMQQQQRQRNRAVRAFICCRQKKVDRLLVEDERRRSVGCVSSACLPDANGFAPPEIDTDRHMTVVVLEATSRSDVLGFSSMILPKFDTNNGSLGRYFSILLTDYRYYLYYRNHHPHPVFDRHCTLSHH